MDPIPPEHGDVEIKRDVRHVLDGPTVLEVPRREPGNIHTSFLIVPDRQFDSANGAEIPREERRVRLYDFDMRVDPTTGKPYQWSPTGDKTVSIGREPVPRDNGYGIPVTGGAKTSREHVTIGLEDGKFNLHDKGAKRKVAVNRIVEIGANALPSRTFAPGEEWSAVTDRFIDPVFVPIGDGYARIQYNAERSKLIIAVNGFANEVGPDNPLVVGHLLNNSEHDELGRFAFVIDKNRVLVRRIISQNTDRSKLPPLTTINPEPKIEPIPAPLPPAPPAQVVIPPIAVAPAPTAPPEVAKDAPVSIDSFRTDQQIFEYARFYGAPTATDSLRSNLEEPHAHSNHDTSGSIDLTNAGGVPIGARTFLGDGAGGQLSRSGLTQAVQDRLIRGKMARMTDTALRLGSDPRQAILLADSAGNDFDQGNPHKAIGTTSVIDFSADGIKIASVGDGSVLRWKLPSVGESLNYPHRRDPDLFGSTNNYPGFFQLINRPGNVAQSIHKPGDSVGVTGQLDNVQGAGFINAAIGEGTLTENKIFYRELTWDNVDADLIIQASDGARFNSEGLTIDSPLARQLNDVAARYTRGEILPGRPKTVQLQEASRQMTELARTVGADTDDITIRLTDVSEMKKKYAKNVEPNKGGGVKQMIKKAFGS